MEQEKQIDTGRYLFASDENSFHDSHPENSDWPVKTKAMKRYIALLAFLLPLWWSGRDVLAQSASFSLDDTTVQQGTIFDLPIRVESLTAADEVYAYFLNLRYDAYGLELESVRVDSSLAGLFGTPVFSMNRENANAQVVIASAGSTPLTGSGVFLWLRFKALQPGYFSILLLPSSYLNEGAPALFLARSTAQIRIFARPTITVFPDEASLAKGDTLQMGVWNDQPPVHWSLTDSSVAVMRSDGMLRALKSGRTKVVATDIRGISDTSGWINVYPIRISFPVNSSQRIGQVVEVPVQVSDLTGLNVFSGAFSLQYNKSVLHYEGYTVDSCLLEGIPLYVNDRSSDGLVCAFAASRPLAGSGTLAVLRFQVRASAGQSPLMGHNGLFNEAIEAAFRDGSFTGRSSHLPEERLPISGQ